MSYIERLRRWAVRRGPASLSCLAGALALAGLLALPGKPVLGQSGWILVLGLAGAGMGVAGRPGFPFRLSRILGCFAAYSGLAIGEALNAGVSGPWLGKLLAGTLGLPTGSVAATLALAAAGLGIGLPLWGGRKWPDLLEKWGEHIELAGLAAWRLARPARQETKPAAEAAHHSPPPRQFEQPPAPSRPEEESGVSQDLSSSAVSTRKGGGRAPDASPADQVAADRAWIRKNLERHYRSRAAMSVPPADGKAGQTPPVMMDVGEIQQRLMKIHGGRIPGVSSRRAAHEAVPSRTIAMPQVAPVRPAPARSHQGGPESRLIPAPAARPSPKPAADVPVNRHSRTIIPDVAVKAESPAQPSPISAVPGWVEEVTIVAPAATEPAPAAPALPPLVDSCLPPDPDSGKSASQECPAASEQDWAPPLYPVEEAAPVAAAAEPAANLSEAADSEFVEQDSPAPSVEEESVLPIQAEPEDVPIFPEPVIRDLFQDSLAPEYTPGPSPWDDYAPPLDLLQPASASQEPISQDELARQGRLIQEKLAEFKVNVAVQEACAGPVITRYEVEPAVGVRGSQVVNLMKDLARALGVTAIRVVETIPGKTYMGLELPNPRRQTIRLSEVLSSEVFRSHASKLAMALGKDITGKPVVADLAKAPHMLVAGTTGSGKSVGVNAMILSLLYRASPDEVRFVMIDPKMLELSVYDGIPHLLAPVVTDMKLAANALHWCVTEMERRYRLMSALGVRNLTGFNQKVVRAREAGRPLSDPFPLVPESPTPLTPLPFIVVVVDEFADLMMVAGKKIEELIARLAQKARAAGIHLILATQRPSVDVITGLIKANIPTRIAFQVSSKVDSRTILDQMGAETLLGQGDMLYLPPGTGYPQRVHGAFVADEEVHALAEHLKQYGEPDYVEAVLGGAPEGETAEGEGTTEELDPLYDQAVAIVIDSRRASISLIQRHLRIGYNRAARLVEQMEVSGVVSPMESNGSRTVLAPAS